MECLNMAQKYPRMNQLALQISKHMSESKKRGQGTKLRPRPKKYQFWQVEQNANWRKFFSSKENKLKGMGQNLIKTYPIRIVFLPRINNIFQQKPFADHLLGMNTSQHSIFNIPWIGKQLRLYFSYELTISLIRNCLKKQSDSTLIIY